MHCNRQWVAAILLILHGSIGLLTAQEKSVRPGINDSFRDPNVKDFVGKFEVESREVFAQRDAIVKACEIKPGETIADIGAGTGLFTRIFSKAVGKQGRVIAVDIAQKFLDHIALTSREEGVTNIDTLLCKPDSTELPPESVDLAFICDTYHHFEFPAKTLASLHKALKPGGRLVLIDFHRVDGKSTEWTLSHVRAGQEVFEQEIKDAGLRKVRENRDLLKENYFVIFEKARLEFPIIHRYGGVASRPKAAEQPRANAKVIFDVTVDSKPTEVNKGLERVARLLNLYGSAGLKASDVKIAVVLHGEGTKAALQDADYKRRCGAEKNPNLPLIEELRKSGVEIYVCGQALTYRGFADEEVFDQISIAAAALTVVINKQAEGHTYVPVH